MEPRKGTTGNGGRTVGVGEVATLGCFHHIPAPPEIMKGLIHGHLANAVLVGQFDTAVDRPIGNCLTSFLLQFHTSEAENPVYADGGGGSASSFFEPKRSSSAGLLMHCEYGYRGGWHERKSGRHISVPLYQSHGRHRPARPIGYGYLRNNIKSIFAHQWERGWGIGTLFA